MTKRRPKVVLHIAVDVPDAENVSDLLELARRYGYIEDTDPTVLDVLLNDEVIIDDRQIVVSFRMGDGDSEPIQVATVGELVGAEIRGGAS